MAKLWHLLASNGVNFVALRTLEKELNVRIFVLLSLVLSPFAIAGEQTTDINGAQDARSAALLLQLEEIERDEVWGECEEAKLEYLEAESELRTINTELSVPVNIAEAKVAKAKANASAAGLRTAAAEAKVKAIKAELRSIGAGTGLEEEPRELPPHNAYVPPRVLPPEFLGCYPSEVVL